MISTFTGTGYSDQAQPHLSVPEQSSSLDSLAPPSHILRTPEFTGFGVNFDHQLHHNSVPSPSDLSPDGMTMNPSPPRASSSQVDRRSSQGSIQRKQNHVLHKSGSWRKKYQTLIGGNAFNPDSPASSVDHSSGDSAESSPSAAAAASNAAAAGLYISAPLSPPVGYPMPGSTHHQMRTAMPSNEDHRASVISSSSSGSGSSHAGSIKNVPRPSPPQWAQPPKKETSHRASSFDSGLERNPVEKPSMYNNPPEHNPEHVRGPAGEWAEVLRGEQGRIAIVSTPSQHEVMVWLPGFSINDITIVTRKNHVLHIVADQWDENDHAQWEIRLGDDAVMTTVRATFSGSELKITVARNAKLAPSSVSMRSNVTMRTASSRAAPSLSATLGHHERSFSSPTTSWTESDRRDLEARMSRGAEGF